VPSRKRPHNMPTVRRLLPSAIVCIDEREMADYRPYVPEELLLPHPAMHGFGPVSNWIRENVTGEILTMIDDDFLGVEVLTGWRRSGQGGKLRNPEDILAVLHNAARVAKDIGSSTFSFSRNGNSTMLDRTRPIIPMPLLSGCYGIMGPARHRVVDESYPGREDVDLILTTIMVDRFGYTDNRFYFDFGKVFSGHGGNVGLVTADTFAETSRRLKMKWGKHISFTSTASNAQGVRKAPVMSYRVDRRAPNAIR
jgi:hypothetical protein